jgi:hypothetical protein
MDGNRGDKQTGHCEEGDPGRGSPATGGSNPGDLVFRHGPAKVEFLACDGLEGPSMVTGINV